MMISTFEPEGSETFHFNFKNKCRGILIKVFISPVTKYNQFLMVLVNVEYSHTLLTVCKSYKFEGSGYRFINCIIL